MTKAASSYQSLRDKMKKRRQAIESLLASPPLEKKAKEEDLKLEENKNGAESVLKDSHENSEPLITTAAPQTQSKTDDLTDLLSRQSAKEREERSQQDEIFNLLSRPTARERSLLNTFKSADARWVTPFFFMKKLFL